MKKPSTVVHTYNPIIGEAETEQPLGLTGQASLARSVTLRPVRDQSQNKGQGMLSEERHLRHNPSFHLHSTSMH